MNNYFQVGIAFFPEDWRKIYPKLQELFPNADKSVSMNKFIEDNLHPDYYECGIDQCTILKWSHYKDWNGTVFDNFFFNIACDVEDCDYIVIDENGECCIDFNYLHTMVYNEKPLLRISDTPNHKESWQIIDALAESLMVNGCTEEDIVEMINKYAPRSISYYGFDLIRQEAIYNE